MDEDGHELRSDRLLAFMRWGSLRAVNRYSYTEAFFRLEVVGCTSCKQSLQFIVVRLHRAEIGGESGAPMSGLV